MSEKDGKWLKLKAMTYIVLINRIRRQFQHLVRVDGYHSFLAGGTEGRAVDTFESLVSLVPHIVSFFKGVQKRPELRGNLWSHKCVGICRIRNNERFRDNKRRNRIRSSEV